VLAAAAIKSYKYLVHRLNRILESGLVWFWEENIPVQILIFKTEFCNFIELVNLLKEYYENRIA
jgi:hypothetical protein